MPSRGKEFDEMSDATGPVPSGAYGDYILRTGKGIIGQLETSFGAYWYKSRFAGKSPILDLGPGRCWFTKQNANAIVAVDNSPELVEHFGKEGINIKLGDAYNIPFPDEYFEGAFCCWLFEHLPDPERSIKEIHRVLKPGGYLCLIIPSPNDMVSFYDDYTHVRPYTHTSLKQLAENAAFARYQIDYLPWTRGMTRVLRLFGPNAAFNYMRLADSLFRKMRLVNRNNLMLEAWKS
jgi:SAM-dependent methyltransferase